MRRRDRDKRKEEERDNLLRDDDDAHVHRLFAARVPKRLGKSVHEIVSDCDRVFKDNLELEDVAGGQATMIWIVLFSGLHLVVAHVSLVPVESETRWRDCDPR